MQLFRPELSLAAGVSVLAGQILASGRLPSLGVGVLGFICIFALTGSALILNDYFDYEVDQINVPDRPLPSGAVSRAEALWLTAATVIIGSAAAAALGINVLIIAVILLAISFCYNWRFKQTGLPGNLMVSTSVALAFILGAACVHVPFNKVVWTFSAMAFFLDLGEEIAGDAMDMEGDKKRNSRSIALVKGKKYALRVSLALWSVVVGLSLLPVIFGWMGIIYMTTILPAEVLLVYFSIRLLKSQDPESGRRAMRGIYLAVLVGLSAFLIAQMLGK